MLRQGRGRRFGCARGGTTEAWRRGGVYEDEGERGGGGEEEEEEVEKNHLWIMDRTNFVSRRSRGRRGRRGRQADGGGAGWHRPPQPQQRLVDASAGQRGAPEEEEEEEG